MFAETNREAVAFCQNAPRDGYGKEVERLEQDGDEERLTDDLQD